MKRMGKVLAKSEIQRLKQILERELCKQKNQKYSATLMMYIEDLEQIAFHEHYLSILFFLKYYRKNIDSKIKQKLHRAYNERTLDIDEYKKKVKQNFHKYTRKDYLSFLKKSEYFFSLYKNPFNLKNMQNKDYLNRTYLGLGFEFLLKSIFLRKGYIINKINKKGLTHPIKSGKVKKNELDSRTYELGYFIDLLPKIKPIKTDIRDFNYYIVYGLLIAQNWRNQDIHTPTGYFSLDNVQAQCIKTSYEYLYRLYLKKHKIPKFSN